MAKERDSERQNEPHLSRTERSLLSRVNDIVRMTDLLAILMVVATAMSAFATWRSARISNLLFVITERPYIGVQSVSIEHPNSGTARIVIEFRKFGHIPASNTVVSRRVTLGGKPAGENYERDSIVNAGLISPGVPHHIFVYLSDHAWSAITSSSSELAVSANASYRGPAGQHFCYRERFTYDRRSGWLARLAALTIAAPMITSEGRRRPRCAIRGDLAGIAKGNAAMRCPNCRKPVDLSPSNPFRPFCSERCRNIDLGQWAGEDYRVPGAKVEDREHPDDLKKKKLLN